MKILIVDDIRDNLELLDFLLSKSGYEVHLANNGKEALDKLSSDYFNLIISDILMPVMDGFKLCSVCKSNDEFSHIPFVFFTATYVSMNDEKFALSLGADLFIRKPIEPEELLTKINSVLEKTAASNKQKKVSFIEDNPEDLRLYNERLIRKLEKKMLDLEKEISKRKEQEEKLKISEAKNRLLINAIPEYIFILDENGRFIDYHAPNSQKLYMPPEAFLGKQINDVMPPDVVSKYMFALNEAKKTGENQVFEYALQFPENTTLYFEANLVTYQNKNVLSIVRDITERKKAEELLVLAELKLRTFADYTYDWEYLEDENERFIYMSPSCERITGYSRDDFFSDPGLLDEIIHPSDKEAMHIHHDKTHHFKHRNDVDQIDFRVIKKDGTVIYIHHTCRPIFNEKEKFIGRRVSNRDITESKKAKQKLVVALKKAEESDQLKTAFLANMSHEIRTPMNGILGFASLLKKPELSGEQQKKYIQIIEKSGERMLNIIHDIVSISQIESGTVNLYLKKTNIHEQLQCVCDTYRDEAEKKKLNLSLSGNLPQTEIFLIIDGAKLAVILSKLVKNAIKYTDAGTIEVGYIKKTNLLEFYVKDTGIGILKDRQEAIFKRFIQADVTDKMAKQGAGLGLAISKAYIEMLGGKIWVESDGIRGATFFFTLPYNTGNDVTISLSDDNEGAENDQMTDNWNLKILIADDDKTSEMLISEELQKTKAKIVKATTGLEAVEICRKYNDIDVILMDIQMPGMNGYQATQEIRSFNETVVIIAQTAFALNGDREKALKAGCNDHISKPFSMDNLMMLIQKHLGKQTGGGE